MKYFNQFGGGTQLDVGAPIGYIVYYGKDNSNSLSNCSQYGLQLGVLIGSLAY